MGFYPSCIKVHICIFWVDLTSLWYLVFPSRIMVWYVYLGLILYPSVKFSSFAFLVKFIASFYQWDHFPFPFLNDYGQHCKNTIDVYMSTDLYLVFCHLVKLSVIVFFSFLDFLWVFFLHLLFTYLYLLIPRISKAQNKTKISYS